MKVKTTLSWLKYLLRLCSQTMPHLLLSQEFISDNIELRPAGDCKIYLQYRMPDGSKGTALQFEYTNFID